jgi:hypothetical protein
VGSLWDVDSGYRNLTMLRSILVFIKHRVSRGMRRRKFNMIPENIGRKRTLCRLEHAGTGVAPAGVVWSADRKQLVAFVKGQGMGTPGSRIVDLVQVWDAATGQRLRSLPVISPVTLTQQGYWTLTNLW